MRERFRRFRARKFSALRTRNFRLFFVGQLISNTGNWLTLVAVTLLVLHLTNSGLAVGLVAACQFGPILLLSAWAGVIVDRSNKLRLLVVTQTLEMCQSFGLAALAFTHHPPVLAVYAVTAAGGCMLAFDNPVRRSFVTQMVPAEEVPNAVVMYSALVNASRVFGPALAGLLVVTLGYGWAFVIDGLSYSAVLFALWRMRPDELRPIPVTPRGRGQVREGMRYVASLPELRIPFVMMAVIGTLSYNFSVTIPLFVERALHGSDASYTFVYSVFSVGSLIGAVIVADRTNVQVRSVVIGAAAMGAAMLALAAVPTVTAAFPVILVVGLSSIAYMTATTAIVQVRADPQMHGRVLALQTVLLVGTTPVGGPILGAIADSYGARTPLVVGGVAALLTAGWGLLAARSERSEVRERSTTSGVVERAQTPTEIG